MHDIDRTLLEFESDVDDYEAEYEDDYEYEDDDDYDDEYDDYEADYDDTEVLDDDEIMDLAAELLAVTDDEELEQFLGKLIKKVARKAKRFVKSRTGRALMGPLKGLARKALPMVGGAIGSVFGGPAGTALGSRYASSIGRLFGLELEGLSPEDQEFEVAKRVVRLASTATQKAAKAPSKMKPQDVAKAAVIAAAKQHAPGLLRRSTPMMDAPGARRSGRWVRRGSKIILMGV